MWRRSLRGPQWWDAVVVPTADVGKAKANCQMRVYVSRTRARCGPQEGVGIVRMQQTIEEFCCSHGFQKVEIQQKKDDYWKKLVTKGKKSLSYGLDWLSLEAKLYSTTRFCNVSKVASLRSWQDVTLYSVETVDVLLVTEGAKAVIDDIIPEWASRMWSIHWVARHRERFNSITANELHQWKSQCG